MAPHQYNTANTTALPITCSHLSCIPLHSYMQTWVSLCACSSQTSSGLTPWLELECVHASVHICMCTWFPMSPTLRLYSYLQTLVAPSVSQSCHFWANTFGTMCTCISTCMHVHVTSNLFCTTFA